MLDPEELRWVRSTANELNNLLQVMSESSQLLRPLCGENEDTRKYFEILHNGVDRAAQVTRTMLERAGATLPEATDVAPVPGTGAAAMVRTAGHDIEIHNSEGKRELIMIVDDEQLVTMLASRVLTDEDYRVITVQDGPKAIEIYKKIGAEINLVILDFTMPIMDGSDVFNELRMLNPRVPVMLSSGFTEQDKLKWMLAKGLRGFIPKPYTQQKLLLQVRSTLDAIKNG